MQYSKLRALDLTYHTTEDVFDHGGSAHFFENVEGIQACGFGMPEKVGQGDCIESQVKNACKAPGRVCCSYLVTELASMVRSRETAELDEEGIGCRYNSRTTFFPR